jgi:hypothetical protein
MGIRYYAYPVEAVHSELAQVAPETFISDDPLYDAWGPQDARPDMLYLDKCWRELQALLAAVDGQPARPAFALVEGAVTFTDTGWLPFERALEPAQVSIIAEDLATISLKDVVALIDSSPQSFEGDERENEIRYVTEYSDAAKGFTARLAREGRGLVCMIG